MSKMGRRVLMRLELSLLALGAALLGAFGMALGRHSNAFALIPSTIGAWILAAILAGYLTLDTKQAFICALLAGGLLQLGYLAGALFLRESPQTTGTSQPADNGK